MARRAKTQGKIRYANVANTSQKFSHFHPRENFMGTMMAPFSNPESIESRRPTGTLNVMFSLRGLAKSEQAC